MNGMKPFLYIMHYLSKKILMRVINLACLLLCFVSNPLYSQSNFSDADAINIFKTYPPMWGFEGVYEIFHRESFKPTMGDDKIISEKEFKSENKKICIYSTSNGIYGKLIDFSDNFLDYSFYEFNLNKAFFKIDLYGKLSYNVYWSMENKSLEKTEIVSAGIEQKDDALFWDYNRISVVEKNIIDFRTQFLLKKIYSPEGNKPKSKSGNSSYGTGFLINNKGYLITNYHVVEDAKTIYVNLNNSSKIECLLIASDKDNDLALLKIKEGSKNFVHTKSFKFNFKTAEVGSDVFTLGYPLIDKMGTEIKVTSGIISSSTGYQGNKETYQITAPIQPGNSGGPLFNSKGEVIGITNAKLKGAENASYAIKAIFLNNLITNEGVSFNNSSDYINVSTLSLPQKIQILKNNIFIISCFY